MYKWALKLDLGYGQSRAWWPRLLCLGVAVPMVGRRELVSPDVHLPCLNVRSITGQDESNLLSILNANFCRFPTNKLVQMQNVFTNLHSDVC